MPGSYLDEVYGLDPEDQAVIDEIDRQGYGSDANPMNMEAMDLRPEPVRIDLGNGSFAYRDPRVPLDTANFGEDRPEPVRRDLGNGGFVMTEPPRGPLGPPAYESKKKGNVEYIYGGPEPDLTGVNRPRQKPNTSSKAPVPRLAGPVGPPPGVVPPRGTPAPAGQPIPDSGMPNAASAGAPAGGGEGDWNGEYYAPGEKGSQWNQFLEDPIAPNGRVAKGDTSRGGAQPSREDLMREAQTSPVPEDLSQIYEREFARQASLTPEQRVAENARREFERNQQGIDEMAAAAAKSRVEAQQNLDAMLAARKKSQEEIDHLKAQPGWWDRRTTGQKVALYADAAFSGMLAAFQGSNRNTALEGMQAAIDQDAEERAAEYARLRQGAVDADELYKVKELVRLRGMDEAKGMILTRMAQYDKNGSMAAAGMAAVQDLEARQADAEAKILEHNWKKELDLRKMASDEMQTAARLKQEDINSRRAAGVQYAQMAQQERLQKEGLQGQKDIAELQNTQARTANATFEAEQHNRADSVVDPLSGNSLGKPKDFDKRDVIQGRVIAYSDLRDRLQDLRDYMKIEGTAGKLSEKRDIINQKRQGIAEVYAKIVDPVGAVSDKSIIAANEVVPDANGWIKRWEHPEASFKSITERADAAMELKAKAEIYGYKPGSLTGQWQARDRQLFGPEGVIDKEMIDTKNKLLGIDPEAPPEETYGGPQEASPSVPWTTEDAWGPLPWEQR